MGFCLVCMPHCLYSINNFLSIRALDDMITSNTWALSRCYVTATKWTCSFFNISRQDWGFFRFDFLNTVCFGNRATTSFWKTALFFIGFFGKASQICFVVLASELLDPIAFTQVITTWTGLSFFFCLYFYISKCFFNLPISDSFSVMSSFSFWHDNLLASDFFFLKSPSFFQLLNSSFFVFLHCLKTNNNNIVITNKLNNNITITTNLTNNWSSN